MGGERAWHAWGTLCAHFLECPAHKCKKKNQYWTDKSVHRDLIFIQRLKKKMKNKDRDKLVNNDFIDV